MNLFLVLPAFNESGNLPGIFEEAARLPSALGCRVIVVDDGSSDRTADAASSFSGGVPVSVERHPRNLGLGPALRTGLTRALASASDGDLVAVMDADRSHSPLLLPAMADKLAEGSDVVVASRYVPGGKEIGLAPHRRLFSRLCSLWLKAVFGVRGLSDYTCGYRLYRASALKVLQSETKGRFFEEDGFACSSELVLNLARTGARFAEVPLVLRYDLKQGKSKMPVLRTIGGYFGLVRRMRLGV